MTLEHARADQARKVLDEMVNHVVVALRPIPGQTTHSVAGVVLAWVTHLQPELLEHVASDEVLAMVRARLA